jgi:uncharacterized protein YdaU (DUF1376 family)
MMATNASWIPLNIGDYLADTGHLDRAQHGSYLLLLFHYWRTGPLPNIPRQLARIAMMTIDEWNGEDGQTIMEFFTLGPVDGRLHQKRSDAEQAKRERISSARSVAGKAGADAKWQTDGKPSDGKPDGLNTRLNTRLTQPMAN